MIFGNSINYFFKSENNDKPDQGYENTIVSSGVGTKFSSIKIFSQDLVSVLLMMI